MLFRPKPKDADPKERALWGDLMSLGMVFPAAIVLGYFIGRWAGTKLGHPKAGILVGLAWGVATGFWELYKVTKRMERMDKDNDSDDHKPRGPHEP
ncbi:MAG: putative F0F1-ATPase subunit Ca2+/Mg2+ transporter [Holophagaceae bacterium]|nr:putative F0F1-ATPase subunit Ca2+/Mg2+ transporter [Holophagaceae bacterium]